MSRYNKKDIQSGEIDYSYIGLISSKVSIGIIGGNRAAYIKAKHFLQDNCDVQIISCEFCDDILNLSSEYNNKLKLIKKEFNKEFLKNKHIIVIAVKDNNIINTVEEFCKINYRIFINCVNFKEGMGIIPVEVKGKNIIACVNSTGGNPKGTRYIGGKVKEVIKEYDSFIGFTSHIRNKSKKLENHKDIISEIISCDEFKGYYDNGKAYEYLKKYLSYEIVNYLLEID